MIDPLEIRKEIARLEYEESSYANYAKLATLYTIRAEMQNSQNSHSTADSGSMVMRRSAAPRTQESEFALTIRDKPIEQVLGVIDELVDSLSVSQPKLYAAVLNKLNRL